MIHPTAVVSPKAEIGKNVEIGPYAVIEDDVKIGDECIIMGTDGTLEVTAEDIAKATGTINYEICCAFGQRLPKVYVK